MPLPKSGNRDLIHTRAIQCYGFKRADGLWDIEGTLTDTKSYTFENIDRGGIPAGEPIHHMIIRLTVDDSMTIHDAVATTEFAPYTVCGDITSSFSKLIGKTIGPGWRKTVATVMGGTYGCTHLRDLITGPLAVTAFQTIVPLKSGETKSNRKPGLIDTCHAYSSGGPVVARQWPEFSTAAED